MKITETTILIRCDNCGRQEKLEIAEKNWIHPDSDLDFCSKYCKERYDERERRAHDPGILDNGNPDSDFF